MKKFLFFCVLLFSYPTLAKNFTSAVPDVSEYPMLPEYCQVKLTHLNDKKVASVVEWQKKWVIKTI